MIRIVLCLLALVASLAFADSPPLSQRSVLRPGLWWDPAHSGSGFDVHVTGRAVFMAWYTYREDGSPVWYTASGNLNAQDQLATEWFEHSWQGGAHAAPRAVGRLQLLRNHSDRAKVDWTLGASSGSWSIEPFPINGTPVEIDRSGAWSDPGRDGFGLTIAERREWLGVGYYAYDTRGRATWWLGTSTGGAHRVTLYRYVGACPACPARTTQSHAVAATTIDFETDARLTFDVQADQDDIPADFRRPGQRLAQLSVSVAGRGADRQLAYFDDAATLKAYLDQALLTMQVPVSTFDFSPPTTGAAFSSTNLIVGGVDEADSLKTDGRFIYAFAADNGGLRLPFVRVAEVIAGGPRVEMRGYFPVQRPATLPSTQINRLFLTEQKLVAISGNAPSLFRTWGPLWDGPYNWRTGLVQIEIFERTNSAQPRSEWSAVVEGFLVASRRIGDHLYVVTRHAPQIPGFVAGATTPQEIARNEEILRNTQLAQLLPKIRVGGGAAEPMVSADRVLLPPTGGRRLGAEFTTVLRIDLSAPERRESLAVMGGAESNFVSTQSLYLATTRYEPRFDPVQGFIWSGYRTSEVHRIDLSSSTLKAVGTGTVEGVVGRDLERSPFRFSEQGQRLRIVTEGEFGALGRNRLSVLEPSQSVPGLLRTVSVLPNAVRPKPLGKPNEVLYGTRFVGPRLYAVTFLQTDPLYVVDLADASDPRILGEVELPGFSDYLHPVDEGLLLGVGLDASPANTIGDGQFAWFQGVKLALFDVSDPLAPRVLDFKRIGQRGSGSALLADHHGLSSLGFPDGSQRMALPVRVHGQLSPPPPAAGESTYYPWTHSALHSFEIRGTGAQARLSALSALITDTPANSQQSYDDAAREARSVLFPNGVVYVEKGRFWYANWSLLATPVGPL